MGNLEEVSLFSLTPKTIIKAVMEAVASSYQHVNQDRAISSGTEFELDREKIEALAGKLGLQIVLYPLMSRHLATQTFGNHIRNICYGCGEGAMPLHDISESQLLHIGECLVAALIGNFRLLRSQGNQADQADCYYTGYVLRKT